MTACLRFLAATWTPEILWFLRGEPRRFGDLRRDLSGVSAKVLTERLRELQRRGIVRRTSRATAPATVEYSLTPMGERFLPLLEQIATLGAALQGSAPAMPEALTRTAAKRVERGDGERPTRRSEQAPGATGRVGSLAGLARASVIRGGGAAQG